MKFTADRPYGDPEKAARKLVEIANAGEAVRDGRIHIELINWLAVSGRSQGHPGRVQGRPRGGDQPRLAGAA
jgi:hypothetical protein